MLRLLKAPTVGVAVLVATVAAAPPTSSEAQTTMVCVNCSTVTNQLLQYAHQIQQLATQAQQLQNQIQTYENLVFNTTNLPNQVFGDIAADLGGINRIVGNVQGIAYNAQNLSSAFSQHYPGYAGYTAQPSIESMTSKYAQWSTDINSSVQAALAGAGLQNTQFTSENTILTTLQNQNMSAQGRQQAAQIANELAAQQVGQMQKLRQLIMLLIQQQGAFLASQADTSALQSANAAQTMQPSTLSTTGNPRY